MKIVYTGAGSQVGKILMEKYGIQPIPCDVTDIEEVEHDLEKECPNIVIHLAAKSNVDWCERNYKEAVDINWGGTKNVAEVANRMKIGMVLLSTDHIFDGKRGKYKENYRFVEDVFGFKVYHKPVNSYGLTKLAADMIQLAYKNMKIIRTSKLFGNQDHLFTVEGEGQPTFIERSFMYFPHFAKSLKFYLDRFYEMPNLLNISGTETVSYFQFCKDSGVNVEPRKKDIGGTPRPYKCGLDVSLASKLGFPLFSYKDGLKEINNA